MTNNHNPDSRRRQLQRDTLVGFLGFFAVLTVIQATINVFHPEPAVWPAVLALVAVIAAVTAWRWNRRARISDNEGQLQ